MTAVQAIVGLIVVATAVLIIGCTILQWINEAQLKLASDDAKRERHMQLRVKYHRFQQFTVSLCLLSAVAKFFVG